MSETPALPKSLDEYIENSNVALAISGAGGDTPLRSVNKAFCKLTGYTEEDVVGRNCRFLQGEKTTETQRAALRDFVHNSSDDSGRFPILNYKKDGTDFMNFVFMTRLRDPKGLTRFFLASQFDMTTAMHRSKLGSNDEQLHHALSDIDQIGREFGLAMVGSAQIISDSVAMMARLTLDEGRR